MPSTETIPKKAIEEDEIEIRLSDIIKFLKDSRWTILIWASVCLVLGILYAFSKPNQYTVQVTIMPEIQSKSAGLGDIGSLAGLAGIDITSMAGGSMDAIRPDIYPDVLQSVPFALQLLRQPVYSQLLHKQTSLQTFLEESAQSWLSGLLSSEDKEEQTLPDPKNLSKTLQITKEQESLIKQVHSAVAATYDKKTGIIAVMTTLPDPVVAATVARLSLEYLTNYISSYRTEKARNQVIFLARQVEDVKKRYQKAEYAVSSYRDQNRYLNLQTAKIEEQRLQADFLLTQNLFNELSKQLEQAKIKVSEQAPVFKTLEPARIPLKKSGPKRTAIVAGFFILGIVLGLISFYIRQSSLPRSSRLV